MPNTETNLRDAAEPEDVTNNSQAMLFYLTSRKNFSVSDIQIKAASPSCNQSPDPYQREPRAVRSSSIKDALCGGTVPTMPAQTWTRHLHQPSRSSSWCRQQTRQLPGKGAQGFWKESVIESVNIVYAVIVFSTLKV